MHELAYGSEIVLYPPPHAHPLGSIRRMLLCPPPTRTLPGMGFFGSVAVTIVLRSFPVPREAGMYCDGLCPILVAALLTRNGSLAEAYWSTT